MLAHAPIDSPGPQPAVAVHQARPSSLCAPIPLCVQHEPCLRMASVTPTVTHAHGLHDSSIAPLSVRVVSGRPWARGPCAAESRSDLRVRLRRARHVSQTRGFQQEYVFNELAACRVDDDIFVLVVFSFFISKEIHGNKFDILKPSSTQG
jgi:hypothetical protein